MPSKAETDSVLPAWLLPTQVDNFRDNIARWSADFDDRWTNDPKPFGTAGCVAGQIIEVEMLNALRKLSVDGVTNATITKIMCVVQDFLPDEWRVAKLCNRSKMHGTSYKRLNDYVWARYSRRLKEIQRPELRSKVKLQKSNTKGFSSGTYKKMAFALFVAIKVVNRPIGISTGLVNKMLRYREINYAVSWQKYLSLKGRKLTYEGKVGDDGLLEHFLDNRQKWNGLSAGEQMPTLSASEKAILSVKCLFDIERNVERLLNAKQADPSLSADLWLAQEMSGIQKRSAAPP